MTGPVRLVHPRPSRTDVRPHLFRTDVHPDLFRTEESQP